MKADRGNRRIVQKGFDAFLDADVGLVSESKDMADGHRSGLQGQVERDVSALSDEGDPAVDPPEPVLVRPERSADGGRHGAVAVGTDHRHAVCRGH